MNCLCCSEHGLIPQPFSSAMESCHSVNVETLQPNSSSFPVYSTLGHLITIIEQLNAEDTHFSNLERELGHHIKSYGVQLHVGDDLMQEQLSLAKMSEAGDKCLNTSNLNSGVSSTDEIDGTKGKASLEHEKRLIIKVAELELHVKKLEEESAYYVQDSAHFSKKQKESEQKNKQLQEKNKKFLEKNIELTTANRGFKDQINVVTEESQKMREQAEHSKKKACQLTRQLNQEKMEKGTLEMQLAEMEKLKQQVTELNKKIASLNQLCVEKDRRIELIQHRKKRRRAMKTEEKKNCGVKETFFGYDEDDTSITSETSLSSVSHGSISDEELWDELTRKEVEKNYQRLMKEHLELQMCYNLLQKQVDSYLDPQRDARLRSQLETDLFAAQIKIEETESILLQKEQENQLLSDWLKENSQNCVANESLSKKIEEFEDHEQCLRSDLREAEERIEDLEFQVLELSDCQENDPSLEEFNPDAAETGKEEKKDEEKSDTNWEVQQRLEEKSREALVLTKQLEMSEKMEAQYRAEVESLKQQLKALIEGRGTESQILVEKMEQLRQVKKNIDSLEYTAHELQNKIVSLQQENAALEERLHHQREPPSLEEQENKEFMALKEKFAVLEASEDQLKTKNAEMQRTIATMQDFSKVAKREATLPRQRRKSIATDCRHQGTQTYAMDKKQKAKKIKHSTPVKNKNSSFGADLDESLQSACDSEEQITSLQAELCDLQEENALLQYELSEKRLLVEELKGKSSVDSKVTELEDTCEDLQEQIFSADMSDRMLRDKLRLAEHTINDLESSEGILRDHVEELTVSESDAKKRVSGLQRTVQELKEIVLDKDVIEQSLTEKVHFLEQAEALSSQKIADLEASNQVLQQHLDLREELTSDIHLTETLKETMTSLQAENTALQAKISELEENEQILRDNWQNVAEQDADQMQCLEEKIKMLEMLNSELKSNLQEQQEEVMSDVMARSLASELSASQQSLDHSISNDQSEPLKQRISELEIQIEAVTEDKNSKIENLQEKIHTLRENEIKLSETVMEMEHNEQELQERLAKFEHSDERVVNIIKYEGKIQELRSSQENLLDRIDSMEDHEEDLKHRLVVTEKKYEEKLVALEKEIAAQQDEEESMLCQIEEQNTHEKVLQEQLLAFQKKVSGQEEEIVDLGDQQESLLLKISEQVKQMNLLQDRNTSLACKIEQQENYMETIQNEKESVLHSNSLMKTDIATFQESEKTMSNRLEELSNELKEYRNQIEELLQEKNELVNERLAQMSQVEKSEEKVRGLEMDLKSYQESEDVMSQKMGELEKHEEEVMEKMGKVEKTVIKPLREENLELQDRVLGLEREIQEAEGKGSDLEKQMQDQQTKCCELEKLNESLLLNIKDHETELNHISTKLNISETELRELRIEVGNGLQERSVLTEDLERSNVELEKLKSENGDLCGHVTVLKDKQKELEEKISQNDSDLKRKSELEKKVEILVEAEGKLMERVVELEDVNSDLGEKLEYAEKRQTDEVSFDNEGDLDNPRLDGFEGGKTVVDRIQELQMQKESENGASVSSSGVADGGKKVTGLFARIQELELQNQELSEQASNLPRIRQLQEKVKLLEQSEDKLMERVMELEDENDRLNRDLNKVKKSSAVLSDVDEEVFGTKEVEVQIDGELFDTQEAEVQTDSELFNTQDAEVQIGKPFDTQEAEVQTDSEFFDTHDVEVQADDSERDTLMEKIRTLENDALCLQENFSVFENQNAVDKKHIESLLASEEKLCKNVKAEKAIAVDLEQELLATQEKLEEIQTEYELKLSELETNERIQKEKITEITKEKDFLNDKVQELTSTFVESEAAVEPVHQQAVSSKGDNSDRYSLISEADYDTESSLVKESSPARSDGSDNYYDADFEDYSIDSTDTVGVTEKKSVNADQTVGLICDKNNEADLESTLRERITELESENSRLLQEVEKVNNMSHDSLVNQSTGGDTLYHSCLDSDLEKSKDDLARTLVELEERNSELEVKVQELEEVLATCRKVVEEVTTIESYEEETIEVVDKKVETFHKNRIIQCPPGESFQKKLKDLVQSEANFRQQCQALQECEESLRSSLKTAEKTLQEEREIYLGVVKELEDQVSHLLSSTSQRDEDVAAAAGSVLELQNTVRELQSREVELTQKVSELEKQLEDTEGALLLNNDTKWKVISPTHDLQHEEWQYKIKQLQKNEDANQEKIQELEQDKKDLTFKVETLLRCEKALKNKIDKVERDYKFPSEHSGTMMDKPEDILRQRILELEKLENHLKQQVSDLEHDREELHEISRNDRNKIHEQSVQIKQLQLSEKNLKDQVNQFELNERMLYAKIEDLEDQISKMEDRIKELEILEVKLKGIARKYKLEEELLLTKSGNLESSMHELSSNEMTLKKSVESLETEKMSMSEKLEYLQMRLQEMESAETSLIQRVKNHENTELSLQSRVAELESFGGEAQARVEVVDLSQRLQQAVDENAALAQHITQMQVQIHGLDQQLAASGDTESVLKHQIARLQLSESGLQKQVKDLELRGVESQEKLSKIAQSEVLMKDKVSNLQRTENRLRYRVQELESSGLQVPLELTSTQKEKLPRKLEDCQKRIVVLQRQNEALKTKLEQSWKDIEPHTACVQIPHTEYVHLQAKTALLEQTEFHMDEVERLNAHLQDVIAQLREGKDVCGHEVELEVLQNRLEQSNKTIEVLRSYLSDGQWIKQGASLNGGDPDILLQKQESVAAYSGLNAEENGTRSRSGIPGHRLRNLANKLPEGETGVRHPLDYESDSSAIEEETVRKSQASASHTLPGERDQTNRDLAGHLDLSDAEMSLEGRQLQARMSRQQNSSPSKSGGQWINVGKATSLHASVKPKWSHRSDEELTLGLTLPSEPEAYLSQNDTDSCMSSPGRYPGHRTMGLLTENYIIKAPPLPRTPPPALSAGRAKESFAETYYPASSAHESEDEVTPYTEEEMSPRHVDSVYGSERRTPQTLGSMDSVRDSGQGTGSAPSVARGPSLRERIGQIEQHLQSRDHGQGWKTDEEDSVFALNVKVSDKVRELELAQKENKSLKEEINKLEKDVEGKSRRILVLETFVQSLEELLRNKNALSDPQIIQKLEKELTQTKTELESTGERKPDLISDPAALHMELTRQNRELSAKRNEVDSLMRELRQWQEECRTVEDMRSNALDALRCLEMEVVDLQDVDIQLKTVKDEYNRLQEKNHQLQNKLLGKNKALDAIQTRKADLESQVGALRSKVVELEAVQASKIQELKELETEKSSACHSLMETKKQLEERFDGMEKTKDNALKTVAPLRAKVAMLIHKCKEKDEMLRKLGQEVRRLNFGSNSNSLLDELARMENMITVEDYGLLPSHAAEEMGQLPGRHMTYSHSNGAAIGELRSSSSSSVGDGPDYIANLSDTELLRDHRHISDRPRSADQYEKVQRSRPNYHKSADHLPLIQGPSLSNTFSDRTHTSPRTGAVSDIPDSPMFVAVTDYNPALFSRSGRPRLELTLKEGDQVRLTGPLDNKGYYEAEVNGRVGLVPATYLHPLKEGTWTSPKDRRQKQLQKPLQHLDRSPERILQMHAQLQQSHQPNRHATSLSQAREPHLVNGHVTAGRLPTSPRNSGGDHNNSQRNRPQRERPTSAGRPDPPSDFHVEKLVGDSSITLCWQPPTLDELGRNHRSQVLGYKVLVNGKVYQQPSSAHLAKCVVENIDVTRPQRFSIQSVTADGRTSSTVELLYEGVQQAVVESSDSDSDGDLSSVLHSSQYTKGQKRLFMGVYDYNPDQHSPHDYLGYELGFQTGEMVTVYGNQRQDGFYHGEINGRRGLVPGSFIEEVPRSKQSESPNSSYTSQHHPTQSSSKSRHRPENRRRNQHHS